MDDAPTRPPRALLFDMDGTLTEPALDYPAIKAAMGIDVNRPILEALAEMTAADRVAAEDVLHTYEDRAARESKLNAGCDRLIEWIVGRRLKTALITRNSRRSVASVLERHGLSFDLLITRECADGKFKPDPAPLLIACEGLGVAPEDAWMIGDSHHDVNAGAAARTKTVWISHGQPRTFAAEPWRTVRDLRELLMLLQRSARDGVSWVRILSMRILIGSWLAVGICAGCASAQQQPPPNPATSQPPQVQAAPAAPAAGQLSPESSVDDVLDALDRRGEALKDFTALVTLADADPTLGNETKLTGRMWMQRLGADDARLRILSDRKEVNEQVKSERQEYVLAGGMLTERNYVDTTEVRRQVLQPGQKMNLLKLGEGPFPLPLGQDKADVHKMFEVKKLPPAADDPGGTIHVQLLPKKGTQFESRFSTIDFWVDPATIMPVRIVTQDPNATTTRTTELKDVKLNGNLTDQDFTLPPVDEKRWTIRSQAYED